MSILDLARPEVLALTPYSSARMEAGAAAIMLNANESPWPPEGDTSGALNRYPEPQPRALQTRMAELYGIHTEQLLIGRGSDEAIDLLVRAFCRPGCDAIMIAPPTFGMYAVCAGVQGAAIVKVALTDSFMPDSEAMLAALTPAVKLVFLCSPNNPTGGQVSLDVIERLAAALSGQALLIVDEAYIEFAAMPSAASLLERYPNLGVLRTLSKAWALAGARIGALLADPAVIALLRRIMPPYPLPTPCVETTLATLGGIGEKTMRERVAVVVAERERTASVLRGLPGVREVLPSQANFVTARFDDAAAAYRTLGEQGIVVRDVSRYPNLANCLRISIGAPDENLRVLEALIMGMATA